MIDPNKPMTKDDVDYLVDMAIKDERRRIAKSLEKLSIPEVAGGYNATPLAVQKGMADLIGKVAAIIEGN